VRETIKELYAGMPVPSGIPRNFAELLRLQNPADHAQTKHHRNLADEWGFTPDKGNKGLDVKPIETDSTADAREKLKCPVIFSPILGSEAVNSLWARLKDSLQSFVSFEQLAQIEKEVIDGKGESMFGPGNADIDKRLREELNKTMFPNTEVFFAPSTGKPHSGPWGEKGQEYWDNVREAATEAMKVYG